MRDDRDYIEARRVELEAAGIRRKRCSPAAIPATRSPPRRSARGAISSRCARTGTSACKDLLCGSVANEVRHRTTVPVLMVRGTPRRAKPAVMASPSPANPPLTGPVEDYLKAIYELERDAHPAATNDIAERLAISPASVSGMMRRLAEQGLITHEPYRGARLTAAGRRAALRTLRRHRVLECYLTKSLGYPWDRVHDEAERLEHAASEELIERMADAIGEPVPIRTARPSRRARASSRRRRVARSRRSAQARMCASAW